MWVKRAVRILLAIGVAIGIYAGYLASTGNFHTVVAGKLYRSAQPSPEQMADWHGRYGIKTSTSAAPIRRVTGTGMSVTTRRVWAFG